jgi:hypothetical protein
MASSKRGREAKQLFQDHHASWEDRQTLVERKKLENRSKKTATKARLAKLDSTAYQAVTATRCLLRFRGYEQVSLGAVFTPRFQIGMIMPVARSSRSYSLKEAIFRMIPLDIWNDLFLQTNDYIENKANKEHLLLSCNAPSKTRGKFQRTSWNNYRPLSQQEFWRLLATIIHCIRTNVRKIEDLYSDTFNPDIAQRLLPFKLFKLVRPALRAQNLNGLCDQLSKLWTEQVIASGVFCIDESLWKYICKVRGTENYDMIRTMSRKPAGTGLLAYELSGFTLSSKYPYSFAIVPMTKSVKLSSKDAALYLIDIWNKYKPQGSPIDPVAIMDGAFSSANSLEEIEKRNWKYCVSLNSIYYPSLSAALIHDLNIFEYRILCCSGSDRIFTAYKTQFSPTEKQQQRGSGAGSPITIINATNAYSITKNNSPVGSSLQTPNIAPSISSNSTQPSRKSTRSSTPSSSSSLSSSSSKKPVPTAASRRTSSKAPAATPVTQRRTQTSAGAQDSETPILGTSYESITLGGKDITKAEVLSMTAEGVKSLLAKLGFSGLQKFSKTESIELLWSLKDEETMKQLGESLAGKSPRTYSESLKATLPMLELYRSHFASIDRVDIFLSNVESSTKHRNWHSRFLERVLFLGFNNARVLLSETHLQTKNTPYPRAASASFLEDLFNLFLSFADQQTCILRGYDDGLN